MMETWFAKFRNSELISIDRKNELKELFKLALPTMITQLLRFINPSVSIVLCGHLSREELDASSLANSIINVLGLSIDTGFSTACDTLFSQAYGSEHRKMMGLFLQRALCVMSFLYVILLCVYLNIEPILLMLGQEPLIASLATEYLTYFLPGLAFDFLFLTFARYLQTQNITIPMMIACSIGTIFNIVSQYYFVYYLKHGLRASATCLSLSFFCMLVCELSYILYSKVYKETWMGFSLSAAFDNWGIFFRLGIPGILMVSLEEWCFEMMTLIAGTLGEVTLGAQAITFQIQSIIYMVPLGLFTALNIRVGQKLGAFNPVGAKYAYDTAIRTVVFVALCTGLPVVFFRRQLPYIFTTDEEICLLASNLLPMLLVYQFCEGFAGVSEAVLLACGRQSLGAITIFIGYYCIGMPIALLLTYKTSLGILGSSIGLAIGFMLTTMVYSCFAMRTDWLAEARQAKTNVCDRRLINNSEFVTSGQVYNIFNSDGDENICQLSKNQICNYGSNNQYNLNEPICNHTVYIPLHGTRLIRLLVLKGLLIVILFTIFLFAVSIRLSKPSPYWFTNCLLNNQSVYCEHMIDD